MANVIFIACVGTILNPCKAFLAQADCCSFSNSTKAISERPGTRRTSLNPANLNRVFDIKISNKQHVRKLTVERASVASFDLVQLVN